MPSADSQSYLGVSDELCQHQKLAHCPIGQGVEAGVSFPKGRNPLRLNSPCALSAKPDVLTSCLASHRYLSGACCSPCRASGRAYPQRLMGSLIKPTGISSHAINELHGALQCMVRSGASLFLSPSCLRMSSQRLSLTSEWRGTGAFLPVLGFA